ncbi:MAG: J domain-containing protein [Rhodospirillales bacterium]|nr:J domain-containing protein [Rhodospirillales bacterium]
MAATTTKQSYTIPCSSRFRDDVTALARDKGVNVGDLARSVVLIVPPALLIAYPDPGEPAKSDREGVTLKSGPAKGRLWRRKPRLQARLAPGFEISALRRALNMALAMDNKDITLRLEGLEQVQTGAPMAADWTPDMEDRRAAASSTAHLDDEELARLGAMVSVLSFNPLADGVRTRAEGLFVLGFPPGSRPDIGVLRGRFRMLATIHHPDSGYGSHDRMSQLNSAMDILQR